MPNMVEMLDQQGGLGKYVADIMQRAGDRLPGQLDERDAAQQAYIQQLQQPMANTPSDISKYASMAEAFTRNPSMPATGLAQALQAYGQGTAAQDLAMRQRADLAAQMRAKMAQENVKSNIEEMKSMGILGKTMGGKAPTPEQLRTVYTGARNEAAQIAKGFEFGSAEEQSRWIEQQANLAVENYIQKFSTGEPVPRGAQPTPQSSPVTSPAAPLSSPDTAAAIPVTASAAPQTGLVPSPTPINKAEKERQKKFATGTEEMAIKDYEENVKPQAAAADSMLQTVGLIAQIPYEPGKFADWKAKAGEWFDALGMDGNLVRQAQNVQQIRPLLSKLANDRLMMAKGTQTEGDAQRAYNEFLKITDTKKAAEFMLAWTEELANRAKFKDVVYRDAAKQEGTWNKGGDYWQNTDYSKTAPVAILNGKPYSFTKWRDAFLRANKDADLPTAISEWNRLTGRK